MNITITVDEITLDTLVGTAVEYDEDGDAHPVGEKTVGHLVAEQIVQRLVGSKQWPGLREQVTRIREAEIRAQVRPLIETALTRPLHKTNGYGERIGSETTLSELIADQVRKQVMEPADRYRSEKGTVLEQVVRSEVKRAVQELAAAAVAKSVAALAETISADVRAQVETALAKVRG